MASHIPRGKKPNQWVILTYLGKGNGYDRYVFVGTEKQAEREATKREAAKLERRLVARSKRTVGEALAQHLAQQGALAKSTLQGYRSDAAFLIEELGAIRLTDLRPDHLRELVSRAFESGNRKTGGPLSAKTVRNRLGFLLSMLKVAEQEGKVVPGLCASVPMKGLRTAPKINPLTWEEVQVWLRSTAGTLMGLAVWIALCTGLRRGEILGLRRCDVDLDARLLHVRQALWWSAEGKPFFKPPKTPKSLRTIRIPEQLVAVLRNAFLMQDAVLPPPVNRRDERLVWSHPDGRPKSPGTLTNIPSRLVKAFGLRKIRFHDLRHTFATLLLESGVSMNAVSLLLGHSDVTTTVRLYGHVTPRSQRRVTEVFNDLFDDGWHEASA